MESALRVCLAALSQRAGHEVVELRLLGSNSELSVVTIRTTRSLHLSYQDHCCTVTVKSNISISATIQLCM